MSHPDVPPKALGNEGSPPLGPLGPVVRRGQPIPAPMAPDAPVGPPVSAGPIAPTPPLTDAERQRLEEIFARLASPDFDTREAAQADLTRLAEGDPRVIDALVEARDRLTDPEALGRVDLILVPPVAAEAERYADQVANLRLQLVAILSTFGPDSDLAREAVADIVEGIKDAEAALQDLRRTGAENRRARAEARERRRQARAKRLVEGFFD